MSILKKLLSFIRLTVLHLVLILGFFSVFVISTFALSQIDPRFTRTEQSYNDFIGYIERGQLEKLLIPNASILRDRFGRRMLVLKILRSRSFDSTSPGYEDRYVILPDSYTERMHEEVLRLVSSDDTVTHSKGGPVTATHVAIAIPCFALLLIAMFRKTLQHSADRVRKASLTLLGLALCSMIFAAGLFFGSI